jgi:hypothetical protein
MAQARLARRRGTKQRMESSLRDKVDFWKWQKVPIYAAKFDNPNRLLYE